MAKKNNNGKQVKSQDAFGEALTRQAPTRTIKKRKRRSTRTQSVVPEVIEIEELSHQDGVLTEVEYLNRESAMKAISHSLGGDDFVDRNKFFDALLTWLVRNPSVKKWKLILNDAEYDAKKKVLERTGGESMGAGNELIEIFYVDLGGKGPNPAGYASDIAKFFKPRIVKPEVRRLLSALLVKLYVAKMGKQAESKMLEDLGSQIVEDFKDILLIDPHGIWAKTIVLNGSFLKHFPHGLSEQNPEKFQNDKDDAYVAPIVTPAKRPNAKLSLKLQLVRAISDHGKAAKTELELKYMYENAQNATKAMDEKVNALESQVRTQQLMDNHVGEIRKVLVTPENFKRYLDLLKLHENKMTLDDPSKNFEVLDSEIQKL